MLLDAILLLPLLLISLLLLAILLLPLLLISLLLLAFLLVPLLLLALLLLTFLLVPLLLVALLLLTLLLLPLLLFAFLLLPLLLFLLLIGLPKHYWRRNHDQGKTKQKHGCLAGLSKRSCNQRENNGLMRQTFRHSCRLKIAAAIRCITIWVLPLHRKGTLEQCQFTQRLGKEMLGKRSVGQPDGTNPRLTQAKSFAASLA